MGKKSLERQLAPTEAKAVVNRIRISAQKLNLVAQVIRGMSVAAALTQLTFSSKRIADDVKKGLQSAIDRACACVEAGADMIFPEAITESTIE